MLTFDFVLKEKYMSEYEPCCSACNVVMIFQAKHSN